jgi:hypothetical protein
MPTFPHQRRQRSAFHLQNQLARDCELHLKPNRAQQDCAPTSNTGRGYRCNGCVHKYEIGWLFSCLLTPHFSLLATRFSPPLPAFSLRVYCLR